MGVYIEDRAARFDVRAALSYAFDLAVAAPGSEAEVAERCRLVSELTEKLCGESERQ